MTSTTDKRPMGGFKPGDRVRVKAGGLGGVKAAAGKTGTVYEQGRSGCWVAIDAPVLNDSGQSGTVWYAADQGERLELIPDEQPAPTPAEPAAASSPVTEAMVERAMDAFEFSLEIDPDQDLAQEAHGLREALRRSLEAALSAPAALVPVVPGDLQNVVREAIDGVAERRLERRADLRAPPFAEEAARAVYRAVRAILQQAAATPVAPAPVVPGEVERLRAGIEGILADLPKEDPGSPYDELGGYLSYGNYGDVIDDAVAWTKWDVAQKLRTLLQQAGQADAAPSSQEDERTAGYRAGIEAAAKKVDAERSAADRLGSGLTGKFRERYYQQSNDLARAANMIRQLAVDPSRPEPKE